MDKGLRNAVRDVLLKIYENNTILKAGYENIEANKLLLLNLNELFLDLNDINADVVNNFKGYSRFMQDKDVFNYLNYPRNGFFIDIRLLME